MYVYVCMHVRIYGTVYMETVTLDGVVAYGGRIAASEDIGDSAIGLGMSGATVALSS